ncbi:Histidine kinase [Paenimyroides ummariense]|uniref:Histidine kinase n=2 Tax=Paenimyroides ummariense TaxID=913024 RepID=A0A1I5EXL6_9FLAO|nr:Histidine kinase [Paenimyroides ummariense]
MQKSGETFLSTRQQRIIIVTVALVLLYLVSYMMNPYAEYWKTYFQRSVPDIFLEWLSSFVFCFCVSEFSLFLGHKLNKRIKWTEKPIKRFFVESSLNFVAVLFFLVMASIVHIFPDSSDEMGITNTQITIEEKVDIMQWILVSFLIAFAIIALNTGNYLLESWKNAAIDAAELRQSATEAELHALRLQIDPHFVFNNLSVLSELILKDQNTGHLYAENFAKIYRYLLVHASRDFISLDEEIKFLRSYIYLLEQRIGEGVIFYVNIYPSHGALKLPPLTLQMLVENALKHNKTIKSNPLKISVRSSANQEIIVENNLNPVGTQVPSSGIGLKNIISRYRLLQDRLPTVDAQDGIFKVVVPLVN